MALARSIVFEPRILLMDEPLSALDKKLRDRMQIELRHLHEQLGMTTVYVTHDQREALTMSDRIAVVNHGRIMQLAEPQQLYDRPENKFVADFIGDSSFLPVTREDDEVRVGDMRLLMDGAVPGTDALLLMVRLLNGEVPADTNVFEASLDELVYQGESYLLYARLSDGSEIAVRGAIREGTFAGLPRAGDAVKLGLHRADTVIIADQAN